MPNVTVAPVDSPSASTVGADDTAAVITLANLGGISDQYILTWVGWSYSADPTGGSLIISDGVKNVLHFLITKGGPGAMFLPEVPIDRDSTVTATLHAGGGGVTSTLNLFWRHNRF
jgi:hypothetical protein